MESIEKQSLFSALAPVQDMAAVTERYAALFAGREDYCVVVLDDDPTGIQTVHGVPVYMNWQEADVDAAVRDEPVFYIQTNTRGDVESACREINRTLAARLAQAARRHGKTLSVVSRSDSTLRWHYPLETQTLRETLLEAGQPDFDGEVIAPCFFEGGRYTVGDVHYVEQGGALVPAGRTEFAKDLTFPFVHSDLKEYVREKAGADTACVSIPIEMLRAQDIDGVYALLMDCRGFCKVIVNAACYEDLEVFVTALYMAQAAGRRFLFRTAASFVRVYAGVGYKPPITSAEFRQITGGGTAGIVVCGSHVKKSTDQLRRLLTLPNTEPVELDTAALAGDGYMREIESKCAAAQRAFRAGKIPVVYTSRVLLKLEDGSKMDNLLLSARISQRFTEFVDHLDITPDFFVAKGGITSSDMATKACRIRRAQVMGQALPGIPVIQAGEGARWPGMLYIIFPGNVGDENALYDVVKKLTSRRDG